MRERREIPLAEVRLEGACEYISIQGIEMYTAAHTHAKAIEVSWTGVFILRMKKRLEKRIV